MACYIVSYELRAPGFDYGPLISAIRSYEKCSQVTETTWAVIDEAAATDIRNRLAQLVSPEDRLFVVRSGREGAWRNVIGQNEWLKENL